MALRLPPRTKGASSLAASLAIARSWAIALAVGLLALGCKRAESKATARVEAGPARTVSIAAAANVAIGLDVVLHQFRALHPDIRVQVAYGSSGLFFQQLRDRAPYDMYMSSDYDFPRRLVEEGLALEGTEFHYARGTIALFSPDPSPVDVEKLGIRAILDRAIRVVAISDPAHTPYGRASEAALKSLGVYEQARAKLLPCQDTAQAARLVSVGTADLALVGTPLASSLAAQKLGRYWELPIDAYPPILEAGVILAWVHDRQAAMLLREFISSPESRATFQREGYILPF